MALTPSLQSSATGSRVGPSFCGHGLFPEDDWQTMGAALHLSTRELQIVQGVFDDHKENVIADELGISQHTVNTYLRRVYHKLRVADRVQLVVHVTALYLEEQHRRESEHGAG